MNMRATLTLLAVVAILIASPATGQSGVAVSGDKKADRMQQQDDPARANALLERAVARLNEQGDRALAAFSRVGEFTDGDLYVYVLGKDGIMLASGGSSSNFIGRNMLEYKDPDGKKVFVEVLEGARAKGKGKVEYRWLNQVRGGIERKIAYYQTVQNWIVAVGYYAPRGTPEQAMSMLWRAVDELKRRGPEAFPRFNDLNGGFLRDDTYVFVVGMKDKMMHAHAAMPRLVGTKVAELKDVDGTPIIQKMIDIVSVKEEGLLDYRWRNPVTGKIENKRTFLRRVGDYMVGVGYYWPVSSESVK